MLLYGWSIAEKGALPDMETISLYIVCGSDFILSDKGEG
jgi:hypothetical protein